MFHIWIVKFHIWERKFQICDFYPHLDFVPNVGFDPKIPLLMHVAKKKRTTLPKVTNISPKPCLSDEKRRIETICLGRDIPWD